MFPVADATQPGGTARFGVFELDLSTGELRKSGVKVRLQEQPFQVLRALVEKPGEVVSREDLQQLLWPDETFVDFEDGLSTAVRKIRQALSDSASNPRFIETLPKRGYRFVAPVDGFVREESPRPFTEPGRKRIRYWAVGCALILIALAAIMRRPSGPLATAPLRPVPLTTYPGQEITPELSPDGSQVAFGWTGPEGGDFDLYAKVVGAGEPVRLTDHPEDEFGPAWSPDGKWIAFVRLEAEAPVGIDNLNRAPGALVVIPALGGGARWSKWFSHGVGIRGRLACWTPDSRWLITTELESDHVSRGLKMYPIDGGPAQPVTLPGSRLGGPVTDQAPVLSPDGKTLAFTRCASADCELYVMDFPAHDDELSEPRQLTPSSPFFKQSGAWLNDGSGVLLSSTGGSGTDMLWLQPLAPDSISIDLGVLGRYPTTSMATGALVYEERRIRTDIWRLRLSAPGLPAGETVRFIGSTRVDDAPGFSPDGKRLAFSSTRSGSLEVWLTDAEGAEFRQLTRVAGPQTGNGRFSPDGSTLLFVSMVDGNRDVYLMDATGGEPRRLTASPANDFAASWSADGEWIYFSSDRAGRVEVWKMPAQGGEPTLVAPGGGINGGESPDGRFIYFTRTIAPAGLARVSAASGQEELLVADVGPWIVARDEGVYYQPAEARSEIRYFDLGTQQSSLVYRTDKLIGRFGVSPGGSWLLLPIREPDESDLMLVEDFR